jgi:hypothetical protein
MPLNLPWSSICLGLHVSCGMRGCDPAFGLWFGLLWERGKEGEGGREEESTSVPPSKGDHSLFGPSLLQLSSGMRLWLLPLILCVIWDCHCVCPQLRLVWGRILFSTASYREVSSEYMPMGIEVPTACKCVYAETATGH